jgi:hypothetical protein
VFGGLQARKLEPKTQTASRPFRNTQYVRWLPPPPPLFFLFCRPLRQLSIGGRFLIGLSGFLFLAPQSNLEKKQKLHSKGLREKRLDLGCFWSPPGTHNGQGGGKSEISPFRPLYAPTKSHSPIRKRSLGEKTCFYLLSFMSGQLVARGGPIRHLAADVVNPGGCPVQQTLLQINP